MPLIVMTFLKPAFGPVLRALGYPGATGAEQAVPGSVVMFTFFWVIPVGTSFFREYGWGTWDRLRASPSRVFEILAGKAIPSFILVSAQFAAVFAIGAAIFNLHVRGQTAALVPLGLGLVLTVICFALALVGVCRTFNQLSSLAMVGAMLLSGVGGALTPYAILPHWIRVISPASPAYWAMRGFRRVILDGEGFGAVGEPVGILFAFSAGFLLVALLSFRSSRGKVYTE